MVEKIFDILGEIATGGASFLKSLFSAIVGIFWTPGTSEAAGSFTDIGNILFLGVGFGLLIWGLTFVIGMLTKIKK